MIRRAYKYRIYPTEKQKVLLSKTFGACRFAWNLWVENFNKQSNEFPSSKQLREKYEWMKEISAAAIQQKEKDFLEFKNQFFNKTRKVKLGRPDFKFKKQRQTYRLPNQKFSLKNNKIRIEKIGWVSLVVDHPIPTDAKLLNVTISKDLVDDYYASVCVEQTQQPFPKTNKEVGIDVGLNHFAVLSDGTVIDNPRFFRESQSELKRMQQHLSRKTKGSNRRAKAKKKVAKIYRKIARQRNHFLHNISTNLIKNFDVICIEDLNVKGMIKNRRLSKYISDAAWSELFRQLNYKSGWYGKELCKAPRFEPTSKKCCVCGYVRKELSLSIRDWTCEKCKTKHNRDVNASINILQAGLVGPAQRTQKDSKTSQMEQVFMKRLDLNRNVIF